MRRIILLILPVAALALLYSCATQAQEKPETSAMPVTLVTVRQENIQRPILASGVLAAAREVALSFKTGGIIETFFTDEGRAFKKGDLLVRLDTRELRAYSEQARAARDKARRDLNRAEKLYADSAATLEQLQNARSAFMAAQAGYDAVMFNLEKAQIRAPFDGLVLKRTMEAGEMSGPGTPVLIVGNQPQQAVIRTALSDRDVLRLALGNRAEARFDAWPGRVFNGHVSRLAGTALPGSGVFEIEITLDAAEQKLLSGFVASLKIFPGQEEKLVTIPAVALSEAGGRKGYVFIYNPGTETVSRQAVEVAHILDTRIALSRGLEPGQRIVERGSAYLSDGQRVSLHP